MRIALHAHFPEKFKLAFGSTGIERPSQCAQVMVLVDTPEFYPLAVDKDAFARIKSQ